MANTTISKKKAVRKGANGLERLLRSLPGDTQKAIARNRAELQKAVLGIRKEAAQFVRETERKLLKQIHAATEEQVRRLERRVARLEHRSGA
jgi:hypothetical protein